MSENTVGFYSRSESDEIRKDVVYTRGYDRSVEHRLRDAIDRVLRWCDTSDDPPGRCLHEIEQICRKAIGLPPLREANATADGRGE